MYMFILICCVCYFYRIYVRKVNRFHINFDYYKLSYPIAFFLQHIYDMLYLIKSDTI